MEELDFNGRAKELIATTAVMNTLHLNNPQQKKEYNVMLRNLKSIKMTQINVFAGTLIATTSSANISLADAGDGYYHHGMSWGGGWFLGPILMILLVFIIIGAVVMSLRLLGNTSGQKPTDCSIEILNERFAKGEIDEVEFQKRKDALKK